MLVGPSAMCTLVEPDGEGALVGLVDGRSVSGGGGGPVAAGVEVVLATVLGMDVVMLAVGVGYFVDSCDDGDDGE